MREAKAIPKQWKALGVWYYPNVGDNQRIWIEYRELLEKKQRTDRERARLAELAVLVPDLLMARISPYSGNEYNAASLAQTVAGVEVTVDGAGKAHVKGDPTAIGKEIALEGCATRVHEFRNYIKVEATKMDADGEVLEVKRSPIADGKEMVAFVRSDEAWESEQELVDDLFRAIRDRSHLEKGLKKKLSMQLDGSSPDTKALGGGVPDAIPITSILTTTTSALKTSSDSCATAEETQPRA